MKHYALLSGLALSFCGLIGTAHAENIWQKSAYAYDWSYGGFTEYTAVSVCFGVWPVASGHSAGVFYTDDGWTTTQIDVAHWERNVQNPYGGWDEEWHWDNNYASSQPSNEAPPVIWYALYVQTSSGDRYWDNNDGWNYELRP